LSVEEFVKSTNPLDMLIGMEYRVTREENLACIAKPRERNFIVIERYKFRDYYNIKTKHRYCIYILVKRGVSSYKAIAILSKKLNLKARQLSILGLKDTDATTAQLLCVPCREDAPAIMSFKNIWIRLIGRSTGCPLRRESLLGNRFIIVLDAEEADKVIQVFNILAKMKIPAYYGYQRFGVKRPNTHLLGYYLVKLSWESYLRELFNSPYPHENIQEILCRINYSKNCDVGIVEALLREHRDTVYSHIKRQPRWLIDIQLRALQALIFNKYISRRIEEGFTLSKKISGERIDHTGRPLAIVPGIGYRIPVSGRSLAIFRDILAELGLDEELLLATRYLPKVRPYWRPLYTIIRDLRLEYYEDNKLLVSFSLEKGMYATTILREVAKVPDCV